MRAPWLLAALPLLASSSGECSARSPAVVERLETISGQRLLDDYILRDVPVVLAAFADAATVGRLAAEGRWTSPPRWVAEEVLRGLAPVTLANETRWGCRGARCSASYGDAPRRPARARTDGVCVPSWALQDTGETTWTFERRTAAEAGVPLGDAFSSSDRWEAVTAPGDLIVFYGGWVPFRRTGAGTLVRGLVGFEDLAARLWGPAGVRTKVVARAGKG